MSTARHDEPKAAPRTGFVDELAQVFRRQVERAHGMVLDGSVTSLAVVDHHLRLLREESRPEILLLVAAGAGAYFAEVVARACDAHVLDDGRDPRRIRVFLVHRFCHFAPVDLAYAAAVGRDLAPGDPRIPEGPPLDLAFHLQTTSQGGPSDAAWAEARLAELAPVPEDEFHTLTCRFETLNLLLSLLAARDAAEGRAPRRLSVEDYLQHIEGASGAVAGPPGSPPAGDPPA